MSKAIGWILVLVIIVVGVMAFTGKNKSMTGPIKIGVIAPLTGDAAAYGQPVKDGIELAINNINSTRPEGQKVEVIYEDGKCNGKDSASAAQKLVNVDKVKFIVGGFCSGETFGAAPITEPAKVILFSAGSSAPDITTLGDFVFRNHPNDNDAGKQLAQYAVKSYKNVAVISENTDYAQGLKGVFVDEVKKSTTTVIFDESYNSDVKDFRSIVAKLKTAGAGAVFLSAQTGANAAQLAKQIRDQDIKAQLFTAYLTGPEFVKTGSAVEGTVIIDVPGLGTEKGKQLLANYKETFGRDPNYQFFVGTAYDATNILVDAINKVGSDTTKVRDYLYGLKNYSGAVGTYSLDNNGDVEGLGLLFRKVVNGEAVEMQ